MVSLSLKQAFVSSALVATVHAQGVILSAIGTKGSNTSLGLQVQANNTADANVIRQAEIVANVVNECGRTLAGGNIDIGENTEIQLANGQVTQATKGAVVTVSVKSVNATGQGPYTCDLDPTGNSLGNSGQTNLAVAETAAKGAADGADIQLAVTMPADMACTGASAGNVCTVRCRNANEVGGCIAVQQTDVTPAVNDASKITTQQQLAQINQQIDFNKKALAAAIQGIAAAPSTDEAVQGVAVAGAILAADPSISKAA